MAGQVIGAVYIYCTRQDVVHALKATLRAANFPDERIFVELSVESCAEHLRNRSDAAVIIDWDTDHRNALKLLAYARADHKLDSRPTMLITKRVSNEIVAAGAEHHVTTVHVGDVSVTSLKVMVGELLRAGTDNSVDKELLRNVSNLRLDDKWTEATAILEKMRDRDPGNVRVACELAENLIRASAWQSAISTLEPFSTIDQPNVRALHLLGRCYLKLGRAGEASTLLSRAKIISPYNVERLVDLGNALLHIDQVEEAQQVFEEALDLSPGNFGATQGLGQVKLLQGELNEGLKLIQSASDNRELASIFNTVAVLTIHRNQHSRALKLYELAATAVKGDNKLLSRLFFNKGLAFHRWSRPMDAIACFTKAIELDPEFEDAAHNIKALQAAIARKNSPASAPAKKSGFSIVDSQKSADNVVKLPVFEKPSTSPQIPLAAVANGEPFADLDGDFADAFSNGLAGEDESFI